MSKPKQHINVFIAYSREDTDYLKKLRKYLMPLHRDKEIKIWYDGEIVPGAVWEKEINTHLYNADVILLLVSANSLASDYFYNKEVKDALERHESNDAIVVPVILRACLWEQTPLKKLQALPKDAKPISGWKDEADAYTNIAQGIIRSINTIKERRIEAQRLAAERQAQIAKYLTLAKQALAEKDYDSAINWANKVLQLDKGNTRANQLKKDVATQATEEQKRRAQQEAIRLEELRRKAEDERQKEKKRQAQRRQAEKEADGFYVVDKEEKNNNRKPKLFIRNTMFVLVPFIGILALFFVVKGFMAGGMSEAEKQKEITKLIDNMVTVQGGTFKMGCTKEQEEGCYDSEKPVHSVTLSSYQIGKYEVTQAQWRAVMGSDPEKLKFKGCDKCPVERVSWEDIQDFIKALNKKTEKKFRLPTEAEWEFAARGGTKSKGYKYAGSNDIGSVAWYGDNSAGKTHVVGGKKPNELGLYDMSGNVYEWCSDWYGADYYGSSPEDNPKGITLGRSRVLRGGSWNGYPYFARVAYRHFSNPYYRSLSYGFRLAYSY